MARSHRKSGPDFRILRPDLEVDRKACRKPVRDSEDEDISVDAEVENAFREMMEEQGRGSGPYRV